jgi:hypothetical protein
MAWKPEIGPIRFRRSGLVLALWASLSLRMFAATVFLQGDDALGTSSINGSTNWSDHLMPASTNAYSSAGRTLRTPASVNGVHAFGGGSLVITGIGNQNAATGEALMFKGTGAFGLLTVSNLTINGGQLRNGSGSSDWFNLAGNLLTVENLGMVVHAQGPIVVNAPVSGQGAIRILGSGSVDTSRTLHFAAANNPFTGNITLVAASQSRFALDAGANLNFVVGAAGVNNSVSGAGVATYDGTFRFDLAGGSTNMGDAWNLATASAQTFGNTFTVEGFARVGGGTGSGIWQATTNGANYSFDTASGILQVVAQPGTNSPPPMFTNSHVAYLRDSVVATNACLMPNGSTYGRAINGISYQKDNILLTFGGYQYTAWYDTAGTAQSVWLARRPVTNTSAGAWEKFQTDSQFLNGDESTWDAHNVIALGICPADGTLHLSWDHHNNTLRYRRSVAGLCTTNQAAWGPGMLNAEQNWLVAAGQTTADVTYPQFTITPNGGLMLNRRVGSSGNGDQLFCTYIPISGGTGGNWTGSTLFLSRTGTYNGSTSRCAYINGLDVGPDGKIHVTWTWREGAGTSNHDICYAYSADNGVTWRNNVGTMIADTSLGQSINLNTAGIIIKSADLNQLLINQQAQCVDTDGRVHVLMLHRREDPGYEYPNITTAAYSTVGTAYYHYFREPATGAWTQRRIPVDDYPVGSRPKIGFDTNGNAFAVFVSYTTTAVVTPGYSNGKLVIAGATKAAAYNDWAILHAMDMAFAGEPLLDQGRLLADNILSVYLQEHSAASANVGTPLHVYDFAVNVAPARPLAFNFFGLDSVVTLIASAGHAYQLQSASTLSPASWANVGPVVTNAINGPLALPESNGGGQAQRFYRVITDP